MKFQCQITAQRKHRPLYFTSDEQFQWMIAILQHFVPDINLELEGLKAVGTKLGIQGPASSGLPQMPMRSLPASLEGAYLQRSSSTPNLSEGMSERSQSPPQSETDRDDEAHAAESLLIMTDASLPPSQRPTPPDSRNISTRAVLTRRENTTIKFCDADRITVLLFSASATFAASST
jgi:hypothetical protein